MGRVLSPKLSRLVAAQFKWITFSFFVGFGLAGCAGDEAAEEPIATEEGASTSEDGEMNAESDEAQAPEAMADEEGLEGDMAAADEDGGLDTAAPPEIMDQASEAVDAELTSEDDAGTSADALEPDSSLTDMTADSPAAEAAEEDDTAGMFQAPAVTEPSSMAAMPMGQVSSPGAAANLSHKTSTSRNTTAASHSSMDHGSNGNQATYVVQSGDTLAAIASRIYGNYTQWQSIAAANGLNAPYVIFPGDELRYDLSSGKAKAFADKAEQSKKTLVVRQGDTLSTLAEQIYGSSSSWKVFLSYNKGKIANPHRIAAGMTLAYVDIGGGHAQARAPKAKKQATIVNTPKAEPVVQTAAPVVPEPAAAEETAEPAPTAEEEDASPIEEDEPVEQDVDLGE